MNLTDRDFKIGDKVIRRSGTMNRPAEVRAVFRARSGKLMLALEYDSELFRIVRVQQVRKWSGNDVTE